MPVAPRDPALEALPGLLPPRGTPAIVCETLREMGIEASTAGAFLVHVRYRPGKSCDLAWRFPLPSGRPGLVSARVFRNDGGARIAREPSFQALAVRAQQALALATPPYRCLEDGRLLLQFFPLDSRLPGLVDATSEAWANAALPGVLDAGRPAAWRVAASPKAYRAWRRCVLQYERDGDRPQRYFAKVFHDDRGAAMLSRLAAVGRQLAGGPWRVVTPAAYLPEQRMLLLPAIEHGVKFASLIKAGPEEAVARQHAVSAAHAAAGGLLRFQQVDVAGLPTVSPRDVIDTWRRKSARIALVEPALAHAIEERLCSLEAALDALPPEPIVVAHGAFRHGQLLLGEGGLVALDLDTLCRSGANADAGNFLACLDSLVVRRERHHAVVRDCQDAFAQTWRRAPVAHEGWLAWHRAAALVKQAVRAYVSLPARWPQITSALLDLAGDATPC